MTQADRDKYEAWIASDLLSIQPKSHADILDRNIRLARVIVAENGECLLDDGHHKIPALLSTASSGSCEWTPQQRPSRFNHGETIRILAYSYNIFKTKDTTCQFVLVADQWEHTTDGLDGGSGHSIDVHSLEAVRNCLQHCLLTLTGTDSGSQNLTNQSNSQNLSLLTRLVDQSGSQNLSRLTRLVEQSGSQNLSCLTRLVDQSGSQNLINQSNSQNLSALARLANQSFLARLTNQSDSQNLSHLVNQSDSQNLSTLARLVDQSDNQNLTNQSNSHNLFILAKLTSQAVDLSQIQQHQLQQQLQLQQNQLQQQCQSVESGTEWVKPASSTSRDSSENMSCTSSTLRPTIHMSVAHLNETSASTEIVPQSSNTITGIVLQGSGCQDENIQHKDHEFELSHQSDCGNLREDGSPGDNFVPKPPHDKKADTLAVAASVAEESISPTQLLELMAQESIHDSKEKVNLPGTNGSKQPLDSQKLPSFRGEESQLQTPTLWDLLVPSDQMKALEQLPGWMSSNNSSMASFPSNEFLRVSSSETNNSPSSGSLFSQPTMKDDRKHSGQLPDSGPVSSQSADGFVTKGCSENFKQNRKDSVQNLKMDSSKFCDRQSSDDSQVGRNNSSSLFSDAEHEVSSFVASLDSSFKQDGQRIPQQLANQPEGNESNIVIQKGIILKSNKGNVLRQCNETVIKKGDEQVNGQSQYYKDDHSQMNTANTDNEAYLKSFKGRHGNRRSPENNNSSAVSESKPGTMCSETSSRMLKVTAQKQKPGEPSVIPAVISRVIDLSSSSSEDIYMIAGHDIYSSSENLVSLTEPEVIISSSDSEILVSSTDSKNCRPLAASENGLLLDTEKIESSTDSKNRRPLTDSEKIESSTDSQNLMPADSEKLMSSSDSQNPMTSANSESVILTESKIVTAHNTCLTSTTHIQHPPASAHTPPCHDTVSKHHRTKDKKHTDKCHSKAAAFISSAPLTKACVNMSSLEATPEAARIVQDFKATSDCQTSSSRLNSLRWQNVGSGKQIHFVKCSSSGSDRNSSPSGGKCLKSAASDRACQEVLENAKASVGGGQQTEPNEPLPRQKSQRQKTLATLESCQKNQLCQSSKEKASGVKSLFNISCQSAVESPVPQPRIVLIDVLKGNKIVRDCIHLFNIHNTAHPPFITRSKKQQMLPNKKDYEQGNKKDYEQGNKKDYEQGNKKDYEQGNKKDYEQGNKKDYEQGNKKNYEQGNKKDYEQGNKKDYEQGNKTDYEQGNKTDYEQRKIKYGTRSNKRQKCDHLSWSNFKKKQFAISITEIGKHDVNVQQIKPLGHSIARTSRGSSSRQTGPSEDVSSTTCFTRIRRHEAEQLGSQVKPVQSGSSVQGSSTNTSELPQAEATSTKKAMARRDGRPLKASQYAENESSKALQASSLFKKSGASDWRHIGPVLDSSWPSSEESKNSWLAQCPATVAPVVAQGSSCEMETTSKFPAATPESQGFVVSCLHDQSSIGPVGSSTGFVPELTESFESSCIHEDESRDGAVGSSTGFVPELTETMTDSEDRDSPWVNARLGQSVASVIHYVCHGKLV